MIRQENLTKAISTVKKLEVYYYADTVDSNDKTQEKTQIKQSLVDKHEFLKLVKTHLDNCTIGAVVYANDNETKLKSYHTTITIENSTAKVIDKISKVLDIFENEKYDYYFDIRYELLFHLDESEDEKILFGSDGKGNSVSFGTQSSKILCELCQIHFNNSASIIIDEIKEICDDEKFKESLDAQFTEALTSGYSLNELLDNLDILYTE